MATQNESRKHLLAVLEILKKNSDYDHPLNAPKIESYLNSEGIKSERRTIYKDIAALIDCGYDINKASSSKDGFYYDSREFQIPEIRLLIDAVASAPFITEKKTNELTQRLLSMLSVHQAQAIASNVYTAKRNKFANEEIYYNIDSINEAIIRGKKISFIYYHKTVKNGSVRNNDGRSFTISPYGLFWSDDKYYVAANYSKYDDLCNYRIDRMKKVTILDEDIRPINEVSEYDVFDTADYVRKNVQAFSGAAEEVHMSFERDMIDIVTDRFGEDHIFVPYKNNLISIKLNLIISEGLINWLIPYYGKIKIIHPEVLKNTIEDKIKRLCKECE